MIREYVANMINKYGLVAIPIIDHENCLVGIVTVDDAMLVLQDETHGRYQHDGRCKPQRGFLF